MWVEVRYATSKKNLKTHLTVYTFLFISAMRLAMTQIEAAASAWVLAPRDEAEPQLT